MRTTFKGVEPELKNYMHFRKPVTKEKQDLIGTEYNIITIARDEALHRMDFLDSLTVDKPNG